MSQSKRRMFQGLNVFATILTIVVNALSNTSIISEKSVGEISDAYPTLFTPAGYVFSIWGIIYTLLLIFTVYQVLPTQREKAFTETIGYFYVVSGLANSIWIVLWVRELIVASTVMMFVLLVSLLAIYCRLNVGKSQAPLRERLAVHLPFSVYLGWITVAAIANVAASLVAVNWGGWGLPAIYWTVLMIGIALIVSFAVIVRRGDVGYGLVIIWALVGIMVKQQETQAIVMTGGIGVAIVGLALGVTAFTAYRVRS
jgi:benzodiazapine receptor